MKRSKGVLLADKTLKKNLETLHLATTLFYHLPVFHLKIGFINPHPFSLMKKHQISNYPSGC